MEVSSTTPFITPLMTMVRRTNTYSAITPYESNTTLEILGGAVASPDVILSGANKYLYYTSLEQPSKNIYFPVALKLVENNFESVTSDKVTREDFMQVLQNLTAIYIKASYVDKGDITK